MATLSKTVPETPPAQRHPKRGDTSVVAGSHVVLVIWSLVVIAPLVWVFISSFKTDREIVSGDPLALPQQWNFDNFIKALTEGQLGRAMINTVLVVGAALLLVMLLGAMCAYVLARFEFFGRRAIYYLMLAGLTFPVFLAIVPLFFVLQNLGVLNTLPGLTLTYVAFALPFTVFFLYSFFQSLPGEISEAAAIDGAGRWRTFFSVMLPMATSGMASVAVFNFPGLWSQYVLPVGLNASRATGALSQARASTRCAAGY